MKTAIAIAAGAAALFGAVWRVSADDAPRPVIVRSVGPKAMRARVAVGSVFPCSSSSNTQLFDGPLAPGQEIALTTAADCVCVEHTFDDFPEKNWSSSETFCRPVVCTGGGRTRVCHPAPDPTLRVDLASNG